MKTWTLQMPVTITQEDIDCIMASALEGGITYWATKVDVVKWVNEEMFASDQISRGGEIWIYDNEEEAWRILNLDKFLKGFQIWLEKGYDPRGYASIRDGVPVSYSIISGGKLNPFNLDGAVADGIVQCALFGDIIYD